MYMRMSYPSSKSCSCIQMHSCDQYMKMLMIQCARAGNSCSLRCAMVQAKLTSGEGDVEMKRMRETSSGSDSGRSSPEVLAPGPCFPLGFLHAPHMDLCCHATGLTTGPANSYT